MAPVDLLTEPTIAENVGFGPTLPVCDAHFHGSLVAEVAGMQKEKGAVGPPVSSHRAAGRDKSAFLRNAGTFVGFHM